jgi:hypothetical protein
MSVCVQVDMEEFSDSTIEVVTADIVSEQRKPLEESLGVAC